MATSDRESAWRAPRVCVLAVHHVRGRGHELSGGAEKYLFDCVRGLLAAGAAVHVNFSGDDLYAELQAEALADRLTVERTDWVNAELGSDRRLSPRTIWARRRWFRAARPDVVFVVQQGHGGAFGAAVAAARWCGLRVVMSVRQPALAPPAADASRRWGIFPRTGLWRRRLLWRSRSIARACDAIVFNSELVARGYVEQWGWPQARCRIIRNGVGPAEPRGHLLGDGRVVFGFVGQLAHHKGCDAAVAAFRRLRFEPGKAELVFFGDGPEVERLRRVAVGLPVRVAGKFADRDFIFAGMDVLIAPSRRESSSNAVLEAMARGIPCIVSDAGGLPELVEDGVSGFVVPAGDDIALAIRMQRLLADRTLLRSMGHAGRARALRYHDFDQRLDETLETIWPGLAARRPRVAAEAVVSTDGDAAAAGAAEGAAAATV
ncbi:MAG: glycosyltransferase family 4 protein [Phycisphaerae bacterium]